jgi:hypothetical protein
MGYFPPLAGATPKSTYSLGAYQAILYGDIPPSGRVIRNHFVLAVFPEGGSEPIFCVAAESSDAIPEGYAVLGTFKGTGHANLGMSTDWTNQDVFATKALEIVKAHLGLPAETPVQAEAPARGSPGGEGKPVRTREEIVRAAGIASDEFGLLYQSYQFSLSLSGAARNWNDDIEGHARGIGALRESEILLAKTDLQQAILNRIIVRLVTEGRLAGQGAEAPPPAPKKPWWKFW